MRFLKLNQESTHERGHNVPLFRIASGSWPIFCWGCDVTIPWPRCERPEDRRCVRGLDRLSLNCFDTEVWRDIFKHHSDWGVDAAGGLTSAVTPTTPKPTARGLTGPHLWLSSHAVLVFLSDLRGRASD